MEIMSLSYHASGPSIVASVDKVMEVTNSDGETTYVPVVGSGEEAERHLTLVQLRSIDPQLVDDFVSVLKRLEPIIRAKTEADVTDPKKIREAANKVARERRSLEKQKAAIDAARKQLEVDLENAKVAIPAYAAPGVKLL